jgi:hypothetical protein
MVNTANMRLNDLPAACSFPLSGVHFLFIYLFVCIYLGVVLNVNPR